MTVLSNTLNTAAAFLGLGCIAPSVHTLNAVSGGITVAAGVMVAGAAWATTSKLRHDIGLTDIVNSTWVGRNPLKAAAIGAAVVFGTPAAINTYDDVQNGDHFSIAFGHNMLQPVYEVGRYGVREGLVPLGRQTTRAINGSLEYIFNADMPTMRIDPVFDARSSFRERCIEPFFKSVVFDGPVFLADNYIRGVETPREGTDREMLDSLTKRNVNYQAKPICF